MMDFFRYDFGYAWPWIYGHLTTAAFMAAAATLAWFLHWRLAATGFGLVAIWGLAGFLITHGPLGFNRPLSLPTEAFLPSST